MDSKEIAERLDKNPALKAAVEKRVPPAKLRKLIKNIFILA